MNLGVKKLRSMHCKAVSESPKCTCKYTDHFCVQSGDEYHVGELKIVAISCYDITNDIFLLCNFARAFTMVS